MCIVTSGKPGCLPTEFLTHSPFPGRRRSNGREVIACRPSTKHPLRTSQPPLRLRVQTPSAERGDNVMGSAWSDLAVFLDASPDAWFALDLEASSCVLDE